MKQVLINNLMILRQQFSQRTGMTKFKNIGSLDFLDIMHETNRYLQFLQMEQYTPQEINDNVLVMIKEAFTTDILQCKN